MATMQNSMGRNKVMFNHQNPDAIYGLSKRLSTIPANCVFLCIGTDRSTGDSFGPIVGSILKHNGVSNVYGTIDSPVHATNYKDVINAIHNAHGTDVHIVAIDAALGNMHEIGVIVIADRCIKLGAGVGKDLDFVGNTSITGIVNADSVSSALNLEALNCTRLSNTISMARVTSSAIGEALLIQNFNSSPLSVIA